MLWILIALAVLVVGFAVRDLLRRPDPAGTPDPRPHGRAVGDPDRLGAGLARPGRWRPLRTQRWEARPSVTA